ncbi:MAG: ABC transporter permease [Bacteroidetes bacterium]|nr:ABC transporter permease [Bacteroidota bacterium]
MKLAFQLAYRNLIGAGLRTWLTVSVLSFAFVVIIFYNGLLDGWNEQAKRDTIAWEYGKGQLLHPNYNPYDPFSLQDAHGVFPNAEKQNLVPVLIRSTSLYPQGRMIGAMLKGIDVNQHILKLPTQRLKESTAPVPAIIGKRMAASTKLKVGDEVLIRWRDKNGTFDASNITIVEIFDCNVPTVDMGQIWISIDKLWNMTGLQNHATIYINGTSASPTDMAGWKFKSQTDLLKDITDIIAMKRVSGSIMYLLFLAIALLAIFDTQVLSVFRRQREIGTYISLGMTRAQVVGIFTVEGSMNSLLATTLGCIYGIPLFIYISYTGIPMTKASQNIGLAVAERIFPVYGVGLILGTILLVVLSSTIVSFLPSRKIATMNPVDALKGKVQ